MPLNGALQIAPALLDLLSPCPECDFKETPDMIFGHLIAMHDYKADEAERSVTGWAESFERDEEGYPLERCDDHGLHVAGDCPGCWISDIRYA